jgi:hypothetical protein
MTPHRLIAVVLLLLAAQLARGGSTSVQDASLAARDGALTSLGASGHEYAVSLPTFALDHSLRRAGADGEPRAGVSLGGFAPSDPTASAARGVALWESGPDFLLGIPPLTGGSTVLAGGTGPGVAGYGNQWGLGIGLRESLRIRSPVPPPAIPAPTSSVLASLFLLGLACARLPR